MFILCTMCNTHVIAQKCGDYLPPPEPQTYSVPTFGTATTTASAFLEEYLPGRNYTLAGLTILLKAGTVFEIDIPICFEQVTILTEEGSEIKIRCGQTLTLYSCTLEPLDADAYWKGITLEDENANVEMYNCMISNVANDDLTCLMQHSSRSLQMLIEK